MDFSMGAVVIFNFNSASSLRKQAWRDKHDHDNYNIEFVDNGFRRFTASDHSELTAGLRR